MNFTWSSWYDCVNITEIRFIILKDTEKISLQEFNSTMFNSTVKHVLLLVSNILHVYITEYTQHWPNLAYIIMAITITHTILDGNRKQGIFRISQACSTQMA